jgi:hypothetical protein
VRQQNNKRGDKGAKFIHKLRIYAARSKTRSPTKALKSVKSGDVRHFHSIEISQYGNLGVVRPEKIVIFTK